MLFQQQNTIILMKFKLRPFKKNNQPVSCLFFSKVVVIHHDQQRETNFSSELQFEGFSVQKQNLIQNLKQYYQTSHFA